MLRSSALRSALLKNTNGTVDTCDALFHEENIGLLEYSGVFSKPKVFTSRPLGFELDSMALRFSYAQSNN